MTTITIDPNVRVRGGQTYTGFEELKDGNADHLRVGEAVEVWEPEAHLLGSGIITAIDHGKRLVFLNVDWASLRQVELPHFEGDYYKAVRQSPTLGYATTTPLMARAPRLPEHSLAGQC